MKHNFYNPIDHPIETYPKPKLAKIQQKRSANRTRKTVSFGGGWKKKKRNSRTTGNRAFRKLSDPENRNVEKLNERGEAEQNVPP